MKRLVVAAVTLVLGCAASNAARSQTFEEALAEARNLRLDIHLPAVGFGFRIWHGFYWTVDTYFMMIEGSGSERRRYWIVRRVSYNRLPEGERRQTLWASSEDCPAIIPILEALEDLPPAQVELPGIGTPDDRLGITMDGGRAVLWTGWGRAGPTGARVTFEVEGNMNSPAYDWWEASNLQLRGCWRHDDLPQFD